MLASGLLTPDWPVSPHVRAAYSTRAGGVSLAPFDQLNLGDHVHDDPAAVAINRQRFAQSLGAHPVFLQQVHGWAVADLESASPDGLVADACTSTQPGLACTVMVADCLPVLFARADGAQVAAAHAGWRGLLGEGGLGILEATLKRLCPVALIPCALSAINNEVNALDEAAAAPVIAWLGPCIGPQAFEVGAEVFAAFVQVDAANAACFVAQGGGKYLCDLAGLARRRLARLGVRHVYGNDSMPGWCTVSNPSLFFSHRRDRGLSGRLAASVWLV